MDYAISIDGTQTRATPNERLEALKGRNLPTPDNQQPFGDGDLNKIMDRDLYEATEGGHVDIFIDALEKVSRLRKLALSQIFDKVTPSGNSLLHVAASSGKEDIMELCLTHYPDLVTRKNSLDDTPLHVAIRTRSLEATKKLIPLSRYPEIIYWKNKDSKSPLYLAVENCEFSESENFEGPGWEIFQLLLQESARDEAYAAKVQGMSPVFAAVEEGKSGILEEIIDRLPKLVPVRDENGGTPLHSAVSVGNAGAVQLLMRKCPDLALQTDKNGSYPIHIACEGGNVDIIRELVHAWPNLAEIKNKMRQNILHVAAKAGNNNMVKSLLEVSSKPLTIEELVNSKDVDGNTPRDLASMHNHCEVVRSLDGIRSDSQLLNNDETAPDQARDSRSSPPTHDELPNSARSIEADVPGSRGQDLRSTNTRRSGASVSSGPEWNHKETKARLVVATLVASVTFTAGITLPGGLNAYGDPNPGMPTMLHNGGFQVFIIFNAFATYSSILSVLTLLRASGTRGKFFFELAGFLLSLAVTFMTVAFSASSIAAVSKLNWLKIFFLCFGVYLAALIYVSARSLAKGFEAIMESSPEGGIFEALLKM